VNPKQIAAFYKCFNQDREPTDYEWANGHCMLAPWTHSGGVDGNPSFGIRRNDTGASIYKCWSCDKIGDLTDLVWTIRHLSKKFPKHVSYNLQHAVQLIAQEDEQTCDFIYNPVDYEEELEVDIETIFPSNWLNSFFPAPSHPYLKHREIPIEVAKALDLRVDIIDKRICFPIRNWDGQLMGLQGRTFSDSPLRYKLYSYQDKFNPTILGNEVNVTLDEPLILTEGFFDLAKIMTVYPNVLCSFTSSLSNKKLDRLKDVDQIITFFDVGTGGDSARAKIEKYFGGLYVTHIIPTEEQGDAGAMSTDDIKEALQKCLLI